MSSRPKTRVGFTFLHGGPEWHGGLNYFRALFLALQALPASTLELFVFLGHGADESKYGFPANVRIVRDTVLDRRRPRWFLDRLADRLFGVALVRNRSLRRRGIDVVSHGQASGDPALKSIGWIPDFQHLQLPQFFPPDELERRDREYRTLMARSDLVVVSSESARRDLQRFSPEFAHKARVLRFCAMRPDVESGAGADVRAVYGLDKPYFYVPNQVWAHKNHLTAVRALADVARTHPDVKVVCSGGLSDYRNPTHLQSLRDEIARLGLSERFLLLGVIPYPHIAQLMLHAVTVINPSLFEGWSTTVEEAKSLGVPMILSGIDVHREQCEHGEAMFFEPLDAAALAGCMRAALARWDGSIPHDPRAALETHRSRVVAFARTYELIVGELHPAAEARA